MNRIRKFEFWTLPVVSAFYAYGTLAHVPNIMVLSGFEWSSVPLTWKSLDVIDLVLGPTACIGLFRCLQLSILALCSAGVGQAILYTTLRSSIIDAPEPFTITPDQNSYLSALVIVDVATGDQLCRVPRLAEAPGSQVVDSVVAQLSCAVHLRQNVTWQQLSGMC